jgi:hypothetical protein
MGKDTGVLSELGHFMIPEYLSSALAISRENGLVRSQKTSSAPASIFSLHDLEGYSLNLGGLKFFSFKINGLWK